MDLKEGKGKLFTDPDPDNAREYFREKQRSMNKKIMTVKEAVKNLILDGEYLGLGGFGSVRISTAVLHEIVRQRKKNLSFA